MLLLTSRGGLLIGYLLVACLPLAIPAFPRGADTQPALSLWDTQWRPQKLSAYRGKIVVLNFWATWCGPCQQELPLLVKEQKRYADRGVVFIAASVDDRKTVKDVRPFAKRMNVHFPVWIGATLDHLEEFGLGNAVPATAFLDRDGHVAGRVLGELEREELERRIEWLLGDKQGVAPEPVVKNLHQK
jgi:thiol-disulfide isomerase/thioredoxin